MCLWRRSLPGRAGAGKSRLYVPRVALPAPCQHARRACLARRATGAGALVRRKTTVQRRESTDGPRHLERNLPHQVTVAPDFYDVLTPVGLVCLLQLVDNPHSVGSRAPVIGQADALVVLEVLADDYTAAELRQIAARTHEGDAARRMLALAHVMDGRSHGEAAALCGMDRQILRDWVHRYNGEGLARLFDRCIAVLVLHRI